MKVISSNLTFFTKYVVTSFYVVAIIGFSYHVFQRGGSIGWAVLAPPLLFLAFLVFTIGRYKKVSIVSGHIVVSNYFKSETIPANELIRVVENRWLSNRHICLVFKGATNFGQKIFFMPKTNFNFLLPHPVVAELELMIDDVMHDA